MKLWWCGDSVCGGGGGTGDGVVVGGGIRDGVGGGGVVGDSCGD